MGNASFSASDQSSCALGLRLDLNFLSATGMWNGFSSPLGLLGTSSDKSSSILRPLHFRSPPLYGIRAGGHEERKH